MKSRGRMVRGLVSMVGISLGAVYGGGGCGDGASAAKDGVQPMSSDIPTQGSQGGTLAAPVTSLVESSGVSASEGNDADYVRVPNGRRLHRSCVHALPRHGEIRTNGDIALDGKVIEHVERCTFPAKPARRSTGVAGRTVGSERVPGVQDWPASVVGYAPANPGGIDWINLAGWDFWVPPIPQYSDIDSILLWPAVLPLSGEYLLQPVLSWGPLSDYGNYVTWQLANWYCNGDLMQDCYHGPVVAVNPGDDITAFVQVGGVSTGVGQPPIGCNNQGTGCQWYMYFTVNGDESYIDPYWLTTNPINGQPPREIGMGVLEDYEFNFCNELPPTASVGFQLDYFTMGDNSSWPWAGYWPQYHQSDLDNLAFRSTGVTPSCEISGGWNSASFPNTFLTWNAGDAPQGP